MKTKIALMALVCMALFACKEDMNVKPYNGPDYIRFVNTEPGASYFQLLYEVFALRRGASLDINGNKTYYSYVYKFEPTVTSDTVWYKVEITGNLAARDRQVKFVQYDTLPNTTLYTKAVAGKNFVAFDEPTLQKYLVIPANQTNAYVPVVLLKDASASAPDSTFLGFKLIDSNDFKMGTSRLSRSVLSIKRQ